MSDNAGEQRGTGLKSSLAQLAESAVALAESRLELASIEMSEQSQRFKQQMVLLVAGALLLLFAAFFVGFGVIAYYWDTYRMYAVVGVVVTFAAAGALLLWWRSDFLKLSPKPFALTLAEFKKDHDALRRRPAPPPAS
jgi:uncharacterized membrane protein YqjE